MQAKGAGFPTAFPEPDWWIELVGWQERDVSAADVEDWDREAPQAFEWL